ncbi:pyridoxamine 5'-phosphate oxidase [Sphingomonas vulcanisoli]
MAAGMIDETDPHALFDSWLAEARAAEANDPEAMTLATVDVGGRPSARTVLLKGQDRRGFVFYTNQQSRKAADLGADPVAALLFHWKSLRRQIRIEGSISRVSAEQADAYFATRPRDSQLGAWASDQSRPLLSEAHLAARFQAIAVRFNGGVVARPPHWGGYRVEPVSMEFWLDRPHRLHQRRQFTRTGDRWESTLLYP